MQDEEAPQVYCTAQRLQLTAVYCILKILLKE